MVSATTTGPKFKVFISFCSADIGFADKLIDGLERDGRFKVSIDPIPRIRGEDWKSDLGALIAEADTVISVLSPEAAVSKTFDWEIECAADLSKRIQSILYWPQSDDDAPAPLADLNCICFDDDEGTFQAGLAALTRSLGKHTDWLRKHSQLFARARAWEDAGYLADLVLTGAETTDAKMWTFEHPKGVPGPTELHMKFISASDEVDTARGDAAPEPRIEVAEPKPEVKVILQAEEERPERKAIPLYAGIGSVLAMLVLGFAGWQVVEARKQAAVAGRQTLAPGQNVEQPKVALTTQDRHVVKSLRIMNTRVCTVASRITGVLATTSDPANWDRSFKSFWDLYQGPLLALNQLVKISPVHESSAVAEAIAEFGTELGNHEEPNAARSSGLPRRKLLRPARGVADACSKHAGAS